MAVSIVIDIAQNSQSVANNTSNVTVKVNAKWTNGSYNQTSKSGSCTIDGTKYTFTSPFNTGKTTSGTGNLYTKTLNITHDSDGTKELAVSASYTSGVSSGTVAASAKKTLTTIPRKSTLSVADGTLGTAQTLTVARQSDDFTHSIKAVCGNSTLYIKADGSTQSSEVKHTDESISFTPPLSWANQNTSGDEVSVTYTITTYNGSTSVGSNSYTKTYTMPSSVKPSCAIVVSDPTGYKDKFGAFVQGASKFSVVITPTASYGSAIKSYSATANGSKYASASFTTDLLKDSGALSVSATVTDNRNRSGTATANNLTVLEYSKPNITKFTAQRCNADGSANNRGAYIKVVFSASVASLNGKNTASYLLEYKSTTVSSYPAENKIPLTAYAGNLNPANAEHIFAADASTSYDVKLTATDEITNTPQATMVSTGFKFMSQRAGGTGIAFGKVAEEEGAAEFGFVMRSTHGELLSSPMDLPEGTDLDNVLTEGHYTIGNTTLSATIKNKPLWYANTTSTASIYVTRAGDGQQLIQRYYPCVKAEQFEIQRMRYSGTWSEWMITGGCTAWKKLTIASGFEVYGTNQDPKYRVNGNIVTVTGIVKPTDTVTSNTTGVKFAGNIDAQYRPTINQQFICQGSGINRWMMSVNTDGGLYVSRYGTNNYVDMAAGTWLVFTVSYSI